MSTLEANNCAQLTMTPASRPLRLIAGGALASLELSGLGYLLPTIPFRGDCTEDQPLLDPTRTTSLPHTTDPPDYPLPFYTATNPADGPGRVGSTSSRVPRKVVYLAARRKKLPPGVGLARSQKVKSRRRRSGPTGSPSCPFATLLPHGYNERLTSPSHTVANIVHCISVQ